MTEYALLYGARHWPGCDEVPHKADPGETTYCQTCGVTLYPLDEEELP